MSGQDNSNIESIKKMTQREELEDIKEIEGTSIEIFLSYQTNRYTRKIRLIRLSVVLAAGAAIIVLYLLIEIIWPEFNLRDFLDLLLNGLGLFSVLNSWLMFRPSDK